MKIRSKKSGKVHKISTWGAKTTPFNFEYRFKVDRVIVCFAFTSQVLFTMRGNVPDDEVKAEFYKRYEVLTPELVGKLD